MIINTNNLHQIIKEVEKKNKNKDKKYISNDGRNKKILKNNR